MMTAPRADEHDPEDRDADIVLADHEPVDPDDAEAFLRHDARHGAKHREWCDDHHVARHLQHDVRDGVEERDEGTGALAERRHGDAEKYREYDDLEDLVPRHGVEDAGRDRVRDEALK